MERKTTERIGKKKKDPSPKEIHFKTSRRVARRTKSSAAASRPPKVYSIY